MIHKKQRVLMIKQFHIILVTTIFSLSPLIATPPDRIERGLNALITTASAGSLLNTLLDGSLPKTDVQIVADLASIAAGIRTAAQKGISMQETSKKDTSSHSHSEIILERLGSAMRVVGNAIEIAVNSAGLAGSLYATAEIIKQNPSDLKDPMFVLRIGINVLQASLRAERLYHLTS
jgi:hypothetical protein